MIALLLGIGPAFAQDPEPSPEPVGPPPPVSEEVARLEQAYKDQQALLDAQQAALAATQTALAEQSAALEALKTEAAETKRALEPKDAFTVDFEGHYRVRGHLFDHLWAAQGTGDDYRDARFLQQRLWLRPRFDYRGVAKLWIELRALENVVFGDNASLSSTALFADEPSNTDIEGQEIPSVTVGRVWTEFEVPVGLLRIGRMPSEWGMGLLVNTGDGFDQPFGEASYPTTNDRILFATRPLSILDRVLGREDREIPLVVAVAVDRLVEDPLYRYYGYTCTPGIPEGDDRYSARCDGDGDGLTDQEHDYQDDTVTSASRGLDWWADQNDDVMQMVYVAAYRGEGVDYLGGNGDLTLGTYVVNRSQRETDSNVWIVDGYFAAFLHRITLETEVISITGRTRALPLPDASADDPLAKQASIEGYAAKAGYSPGPLALMVETGFASGDDDVLDGAFTGRSLHPDHNVGLLLYEQVLAQVTASVRTTSARGLWSNGGVYSSRYVFPTVTVEPIEDTQLVVGGVVAWPNAPDGAVIRCRASDAGDCDTPPASQATADTLGWEIDAAIKHRWARHLLVSLEGGVAHATDRLPLESAGLNPKGNFVTVQSRIAWEF